jgi:YbbR domain-containing protein
VRPGLFTNLRYKLIATLAALLLWGVSNTSSSIERGFDVPMRLTGVPENLVVTWQSAEDLNVRVMGSRAALRTLSVGDLQYPIVLEGAKSGTLTLDVDLSALEQELPRGARIVSRSPSRVEIELAPRGSKAVRVRPDVAGEPAEGFVVAGVEVDPPRVRITGPRAEVLRLNEVMTETVDVRGVSADVEREVRLSLPERHVQPEDATPIKVRVLVQPAELPGEEAEGADGAPPAAQAEPEQRPKGGARRAPKGEAKR